jgi:hypothetical protein
MHHLKQINRDLMAEGKVYHPKDCIRIYVETKMTGGVNPLVIARRDIVCRLHGKAPLLDVSFTLRAGEAVHHLRTVLDHLVYQMVIAHTKQPPRFHSAFPIVGKGKKRKQLWQTPAEYYACQTSALKNVISADAAALIQSLQPYERLGSAYEDDPLWQLSELDNAYKHRLLAVVGHKLKSIDVTIRRGTDTIATAHFQPNILFEDRAEIGRMAGSDISIADADVSVDCESVFAIAFPKVAGRSNIGVFECIGDIAKYVKRIINDVSALREFA